MPESRGSLVIIGGHEDRDGERLILREVARLAGQRPLMLCAAASESPEQYVTLYRKAFHDLGVEVIELTTDSAAAAGAGGVFFSGGNQNRLSSAIRGSELETIVHTIRDGGGVIAGTSAGASVMSDIMLAGGESDSTPEDGDTEFAPGLGLMTGVLIDQHFAERGRIGRLAKAVGVRPDLLGIGIDEDTAVVVAGDQCRVIGAGGVYLLDAAAPELDGLRLHLLGARDVFDLKTREELNV